jgi:hypothetical protein
VFILQKEVAMPAVVVAILFVLLIVFVPIGLLPALIGKDDLDSVVDFHE